MRRTLCYTPGLVLLVMAALASPAGAQTVAVGPYYATPSWDQTVACVSLASCPRFVVLSNMSNEAVLDRETGAVWERTPTTFPGFPETFQTIAAALCYGRKTGGRYGWRLPSIQEFMSLIDPSIPGGSVRLPPGHPFVGIEVGDDFHTATLDPIEELSWSVLISSPAPQRLLNFTVQARVWCVRGPEAVGR